MSLGSRAIAAAARIVSDRSFELIVAPALADLQFEQEAGRRTASRLAVYRAIAGALRTDVAHHAGGFVLLSMVPAGYFFVLMAVCFDFFSGERGIQGVIAASAAIAHVAAPLLLLSFATVIVCFWPERRVARSLE